jgi:hypothetical protein
MGKILLSNSDRQRININGALCFHAMDVIYRDDQTIDRLSTLNLLKQFRDAVLEFFENIDEYKDELSSLLVYNFQIIGN